MDNEAASTATKEKHQHQSSYDFDGRNQPGADAGD